MRRFFQIGEHGSRMKQNLVGGFNLSEKYESQLGWLFSIYGKIKKCSSHHQPDHEKIEQVREFCRNLGLRCHNTIHAGHLSLNKDLVILDNVLAFRGAFAAWGAAAFLGLSLEAEASGAAGGGVLRRGTWPAASSRGRRSKSLELGLDVVTVPNLQGGDS